MFRKFLVMALVAAITALVAPATSQAAFSIQLQVGALTGTITDNNVPGPANQLPTADKDGNLTSISTSLSALDAGLSFGGFNIKLNSLLTSNTGESRLDTNTNFFIVNQTAGAVALFITVTESAFTSPGNAPNALLLENSLTTNVFTTGGVGGSGGAAAATNSVSAQAFASPLPAQTPIVTLFATGPIGQSLNSSVIFNRTANQFAVSQVFTVNLAQGDGVRFNGSASVVSATPAPVGLLLAAFGIPAFGLLRRIGRKSGVAQVAV